MPLVYGFDLTNAGIAVLSQLAETPTVTVDVFYGTEEKRASLRKSLRISKRRDDGVRTVITLDVACGALEKLGFVRLRGYAKHFDFVADYTQPELDEMAYKGYRITLTKTGRRLINDRHVIKFADIEL